MSIEFLIVDGRASGDAQVGTGLTAAVQTVDPEIGVHIVTGDVDAGKILTDCSIDCVILLWPEPAGVGSAQPAASQNSPPLPGVVMLERILATVGELRPILVVLLSVHTDMRPVDALQRDGVIDHYQAIPNEFRGGDAAFDQLVTFIRWQLQPLHAIRRQGVIVEKSFARFLTMKRRDWRCYTTTMLMRLADLAEQQNDCLLDIGTYRHAVAQGLLPDLDRYWGQAQCWLQALAGFKQLRPWHPWCERTPDSARVRFFREQAASSEGRSTAVRVLMLIDPRYYSDYTTGERQEIEKHFCSLAGSCPGVPIRIDLPARAPGSRAPWLLGAWFELSLDGEHEWVPLTVLRQRSIAKQPLRTIVRDLVAAVASGSGENSLVANDRYGVLFDGVLVKRVGSQIVASDQWCTPLLPLHRLHIAPDPTATNPLPYQFLQQLHNLNDWLRIATYWFTWGLLPDLNTREDVARCWQGIQDLLHGVAIDIDIRGWWSGSQRRDVAELERVERREERLHFSDEVRCLDQPGTRSLTVRQVVSLISCVCRCDIGVAGEAVALFEQIAFVRSVSLHRCRIEQSDGHLGVLSMVDCWFHDGLNLSGIQASGIELVRCRFQTTSRGQPVLSLSNTVLAGSVRFVDCVFQGEGRIEHCQIQDLIAHCHGGELFFGPNLVVQTCLELDLCAGAVAVVSHAELRDRVDVRLDDRASLTLQYCRFSQDIYLDLTAGCRPVCMARCQVGGHFSIIGPADVPTSADGTIGDVLLGIEECRLDRDLKTTGWLSMQLRDVFIEQNLVVRKCLSRLRMDDCQVGCDVELSDTQVLGDIEMQRVRIDRQLRAERGRFQRMSMAATLCLGEGLFAGSRYQGGVHLALQRDESDEPVAICSTLFRNQLDFSHAIFEGVGDFAHVICERLLRFDGAKFMAEANFSGLQADSHVSFHKACFCAAADFRRCSVGGLFEMQQAIFHYPPVFDGSTFRGSLRFRDTQWPPSGQSGIAGSFQKVVVGAMLELCDPRDTDGYPLPSVRSAEFAVDCKDASIAALDLDERFMTSILDYEEKILAQLPQTERRNYRGRLLGVAQLFERSQREKLNFRAADAFVRRGNRYSPRPGLTLMRWLWGHGTQPALPMLWMVGLFVVVWTSWLVLNKFLFADALTLSPKLMINLPWLGLAVAAFTFGEIVLLTMFFAALARKLLRWS